MGLITKPMLAEKLMDKQGVIHFEKIKYPVLGTPKLDGYRCVKTNGQALSRKFKPIRNQFVRETIEAHFPDDVDGELMIPGLPFNKISSAISRRDGNPDFRFFVFDYVPISLDEPYERRVRRLEALAVGNPWCVPVVPTHLFNEKELLSFEEKCLAMGYEGICIRSLNSPYKLGRSTVNQGYLIKIKRFDDSEARIIGYIERMHNDNELERDELGYAKRSSHKDNLVPLGRLGKLIVVDVKTGMEFGVGSGFDEELQNEIWRNRDYYLGRMIKYKFQPTGAKDLPRFPTFIGFRDEDDVD